MAMVVALTIANSLLVCYPIMSSKHSFFYFCVPFEVSMASTVTEWGKHATIYLVLASRLTAVLSHLTASDWQ
jgi:hypothetical protein